MSTASTSIEQELPSDLAAPFTQNETYLDLSDPQFKRHTTPRQWRKYKKHEIHNRGLRLGKWSDKSLRRNQDDKYLCRIIAAQVDLPKFIRPTVWNLFKKIDLRKFKKYEPEGWKSGESTSKQYLVIHSICAILYNIHQPDPKWRYYPGKKYTHRPRYGAGLIFVEHLDCEPPKDCYVVLDEFAQRLGFNDNVVRSCMEKVRYELSNQNLIPKNSDESI